MKQIKQISRFATALSWVLQTSLGISVLTSCAADPSEFEQAMAIDELRQCASGGTVDGIDVSTYQGQINWTSVRNDGVEFAFIRAGNGLTRDTAFSRNWSGARQAGVLRGAYQYFRPGRDPVQQADLFVDTMGDLADNDLPPVLDLETTDGVSRATVLSRARAWLNRVEERTGRTPIIYSGYYFWRDTLGNPSWGGDYSLWLPQYGRTCPTINAPPWQRWDFWQTSETGRVRGITGAVDLDFFQGSRANLLTFIANSFVDGPPVVSMPPVTGCPMIQSTGGTVEDTGACFVASGPTASWRTMSNGSSGLHWTYATLATRSNYARWALPMASAGQFEVQVYIDNTIAQSKQASYTVFANGRTSIVRLDQSTTSGWRSLGTFSFASGTGQFLELGDNTGEPLSMQRRLVFDAVRLVPAP